MNTTIGNFIQNFDTLENTNDCLKQDIQQKGLLHGSIVQCQFQTKGKGQKGNLWKSEKGKNILLSVALDTSFLSMQDIFSLHTFVTLACKDFFEKILKRNREKVYIKWVNDIIIQNKKIGGILIENTLARQKLHYTIVGIGLNINQKHFSEHLPHAISLYNITQKIWDIKKCVQILCSCLEKRFQQLIHGKLYELFATYKSSLYLLNKKVYWIENENTYSGVLSDITEKGEICIRTNNILKKFNFGEIKLLIHER